MLDWKSSLGFNETIKYTAEWYKAYFEKKVIKEITERQIVTIQKSFIKIMSSIVFKTLRFLKLKKFPTDGMYYILLRMVM